jgi:hypothetical protein
MPSTYDGKPTIGDYNPVLKEGHHVGGGIQQAITVPLGPHLLVDGKTYKGVVFVAPCDGCVIKELHASASVAIAGGTDTLAVDNYDKSATTARNVLSTATIDPTSITALQGVQLTLSSTAANLLMDAGDVLNYTLVCGTMTTDGEGLSLTAIIVVPDLV